jgi:hypothetical protein
VSDSNRRQFFRGALAALAQAAGTVTLASAAVAPARLQQEKKKPDEGEAPPGDNLQQRADELAAARGPAPEAESAAAGQFRNGGWRNGNWFNGGWRNFPWFNSTWSNFPWNNFPWFNGGWFNGGWRNF